MMSMALTLTVIFATVVACFSCFWLFIMSTTLKKFELDYILLFLEADAYGLDKGYYIFPLPRGSFAIKIVHKKYQVTKDKQLILNALKLSDYSHGNWRTKRSSDWRSDREITYIKSTQKYLQVDITENDLTWMKREV